ncbi:MAG: cation-translocating P-type ATPase [Candidatus Omnitrophica bacterium]|nr:cation-translocating P-type ATPase [Candidatus Omnitrophota bacterium]
MAPEKISELTGLTEAEAAARLERDGYNELPSSRRRSMLGIILDVLREPMFLLLVACGTIYMILGDVGEAVMLLGFVFVILGITVYQEGKTEKAIEALRDLSSPRALVIRDGVQKRIAGRMVVTGDNIVLREGDRVPADAVLIWGINVTVDESLLTGESVPVRKISRSQDDTAKPRPGGDDLPYLYSGSLIVQGQGVAAVMATGAATEMGKIGKALGSIKKEETSLQKETGSLVKMVFIIASVLCLVVVFVYGVTRGNWLQGILSGITLAMAMLPEEFPVVLTIFLALGAWRISQKNVLTRRIVSVETLGSATVLCVDKTGTLTQNRMTIKKIFNGRNFYDVEEKKNKGLPEQFHELVEYGILASKQDPFDPMEKALKELGQGTIGDTEHIHTDWPLVKEYPLSKEMMALSHVWEGPGGKKYVIAAKGAPEAIADLCHTDPQERALMDTQVQAMAGEGMRVLGVAKAVVTRQELPTSQHDFDFRLIGLIGLADPVRDTVLPAIRECYNAGIRVVMITGDYPVTAQNIARQIGFRSPDRIITGPELEKMPLDELKKKIRTTDIFARVVPEQKLQIVKALKANGEIVAMTGDGVNDAPALKAADIGIAMGERGTDVARESSGLVLLNDDFSSIVEAVRLGRRIFDNLKKAMSYIISVHIPIAGLSLIPVMLGWPLILYPAHIVFLELVIDPACSVVFESEPAEQGVMIRPPRNPRESLFGKRPLIVSFLQGLFALIIVIAVFKFALYKGHSEAGARTLTFITLVVSNLCMILTNRSWTRNLVASLAVPNQALLAVVGGTMVFLYLTVRLPVLERLFHFSTIHVNDLATCLAAGGVSVLWFELVKVICSRLKIKLI